MSSEYSRQGTLPFVALALSIVLSNIAVGQTITQLTDTISPSMNVPKTVSADGSKVLTLGINSDLAGTNPDLSRELFRYDVTMGAFLQLTSRPKDPVEVFLDGVMSDDGSLVAFIDNGDPVGLNADGGLEIFLFNVATGLTTQVTNAPFKGFVFDAEGRIGGTNLFRNLDISGDGSRVTFGSALELTGPNAPGGTEIFVINTDGTGLVQVSSATVHIGGRPTNNPALNFDGSVVTYVSLDPQNPSFISGGGGAIYRFDLGTGVRTQVTPAISIINRRISLNELSGDGQTAVITAREDFTGENPSFFTHVFSVSISTGVITQITPDDGTRHVLNTIDVNFDGSRITFVSNADLVPGSNVDRNNEVFVFDTTTGFRQATFPQPGDSPTPLGPFDVRISANENAVAFSSSRDYTLLNPDRNPEVFLTTLAAANRPPIANAGSDLLVECQTPTGATVSLDGTQSFDPDPGDAISFLWSAHGVIFNNPASATPTGHFPMGPTEVTLTVDDGELLSQDIVLVIVQDTTPPLIDAGSDPVPYLEGEAIVLPTPAVTDLCDPAPTIADDAPATFPIGSTIVIFTATDASGNAASDSIVVTVVSLRDALTKLRADLVALDLPSGIETSLLVKLDGAIDKLDQGNDVAVVGKLGALKNPS